MIDPFFGYFDKSIKRMVMASLVFVLLVPIGFFISSLFENSWSQAQQRMLEKHQLISTALVEPFTLFISSRQKSLQTLSDDIVASQIMEQDLHKNSKKIAHHNKNNIQAVIDKYSQSFGDLVAVSYISEKRDVKLIATNKEAYSQVNVPDYSKIPLSIIKTNEGVLFKNDLLSPVFMSPVSKEPVVLLKHFISNKNNTKMGAICAEISLKYIESMCSKINFGVKGHCAIVDQTGHVVAHPNKSWIKEIRDLSNISVVKRMMAGESGTTEFYSPFLKADMVAGFSAIPALGWGVMIPQPKSELTASFNTIRANTLQWLLAGLLIALFIAYILMNKITKPINYLMKRAREVDSGYDHIGLGPIPKNSPREIKQLWGSFAALLTGLQKSNNEVKKLNVSLNRDIHKATKELRDMNKHLHEINNKDYLTSIANRRYFNSYLKDILIQGNEESVGIILIDVDEFKRINDKYGHDAGDCALQHVSNILEKSIRKVDLVARLGGDEFIVYLKDSDDSTLANVAEKLRLFVEINPVKWEDETINITLSIGLFNYTRSNKKRLTLKELLIYADKAMYVSKHNGRNQINVHSVEKSIEIEDDLLTTS